MFGNIVRKYCQEVRKHYQKVLKHCQKVRKLWNIVWKYCPKARKQETLSESLETLSKKFGNIVRKFCQEVRKYGQKDTFYCKKNESPRTLSMPGEKEQKQFRNIDRKRNKAHKFVLLMARRMAYCLKATYSTSHFPFKFLIKASKGNFHF